MYTCVYMCLYYIKIYFLKGVFKHLFSICVLLECMYVYHVHIVPSEARRRFWIFWDWNYRWLYTTSSRN